MKKSSPHYLFENMLLFLHSLLMKFVIFSFLILSTLKLGIILRGSENLPD